jgi:hypothetical protein
MALHDTFVKQDSKTHFNIGSLILTLKHYTPFILLNIVFIYGSHLVALNAPDAVCS